MRHFNYKFSISSSDIIYLPAPFWQAIPRYTTFDEQVRGIRISSANDRKSWWSLCKSTARAVKNDHKDESAHDTQQWTIPIDASGPRCKLSVHWLRSCICDSLNQDVTTISSYVGFFFRTFISSPVRLSLRRTAYRSSFILPIRMRLLFVLSRWFGPINLGYAPCVWMCKFERALI